MICIAFQFGSSLRSHSVSSWRLVRAIKVHLCQQRNWVSAWLEGEIQTWLALALTFVSLQNPDDYCNDPDCAEGCMAEHGSCIKPNVCKCRSGYYGHGCQRCVPLPGKAASFIPPTWPKCLVICFFCTMVNNLLGNVGGKLDPSPTGCINGNCSKAYQCNCFQGWSGIFCSDRKTLLIYDELIIPGHHHHFIPSSNLQRWLWHNERLLRRSRTMRVSVIWITLCATGRPWALAVQ